MKSKKLLAVSLCGALCLSLAGFTYASAQTADTPKTSAEETAQTSSTDILFNDADGISTDGENWVAEADYEKNNPTPDVEWWTAEEYEKWIAEQKKELEALIGTGDGLLTPCGACRQVMAELMRPDAPVIMADGASYRIMRVCELLPYAFDKEDLNGI